VGNEKICVVCLTPTRLGDDRRVLKDKRKRGQNKLGKKVNKNFTRYSQKVKLRQKEGNVGDLVSLA